MRFPILALAIFGTIVSMSISATAILPRRGLIDLTTSPDGPDSAVAPPRAADRPHQATREEVVARAALRARQPAKRQTSAVSVCARPDTGTVPYAVLTNSYFYTSNQIGGDITESQADCYAACEADTGCAAAAYTVSTSTCRLLSALQPNGGSIRGNGNLQGEARGYTCAQLMSTYPNLSGAACCDAMRT